MTIVLVWFFFALFLGGIMFALSLVLSELWRVTWRNGVPSLSSTWAILDSVLANNILPKDGMIVDLGCGNSWALRRMWRAGLRGPFVGYEREFTAWFVGSLWNLVMSSPVTIVRADFRKAPIEQAKGIYLFLLPEALRQLKPIIEERAQPGTVVVSAEFEVPGWTPTQVLHARGVTCARAPVYCYVI